MTFCQRERRERCSRCRLRGIPGMWMCAERNSSSCWRRRGRRELKRPRKEERKKKTREAIMELHESWMIRHRFWVSVQFLIIISDISVRSRVAQWKRAGPITQRSVDRNYALLCNANLIYILEWDAGCCCFLYDSSKFSILKIGRCSVNNDNVPRTCTTWYRTRATQHKYAGHRVTFQRAGR